MGPGDTSWPCCSHLPLSCSGLASSPAHTSPGPPIPTLQFPSASYPFPPTLASPAVKRVESFLSYQPSSPPPWLHSNCERNSWQGRVGAYQLPGDSFLDKEKVPLQCSLRRQVRGMQIGGGEERTPKGRERHPGPGADGQACAVKSGRERKKAMVGPETPGETQTPVLSATPSQRASLAVVTQ